MKENSLPIDGVSSETVTDSTISESLTVEPPSDAPLKAQILETLIELKPTIKPTATVPSNNYGVDSDRLANSTVADIPNYSTAEVFSRLSNTELDLQGISSVPVPKAQPSPIKAPPSPESAQVVLSSGTVADTNSRLVLEFTNDIIDKQYRSYLWNDGKVQALVTVDTALIAGLLLILQIYRPIGVLAFVVLMISFLCLLVSFLVCLIHAVPRIHSGVGQDGNLRTMVGIGKFNKEDYHTEVLKIGLTDILRMNCWQIAGMCKNNLRSHRLITYGVHLTIIGVLSLAVALSVILFSDWKAHDLSAQPPHIMSPVFPPLSTGAAPAPSNGANAQQQTSGGPTPTHSQQQKPSKPHKVIQP